MTPGSKGAICAVAIVKGDERFIEEWLVYHRLIGVDEFFVYDNDPELPLRSVLERYQEFVTVIDWPGDPTADWPGRNLQTKTYEHALKTVARHHDWVAFLDVDEFIVLRRHADLPAFLSSLGSCGSVRLHWHVFGHNGHYEDPEGLVTAALTRRMAAPSPRTKAISRPEAVDRIDSAHRCRLKKGWRTLGPDGRPWSDALEPGKTDVAHINHYQCRSFLSWMRRVERGDVSFDPTNVPSEHAWRLDEQLCLRQFVETVAKDKNELVDEYMLRFEGPILEQLSAFSTGTFPTPDPPEARRPGRVSNLPSGLLRRIRSSSLWRRIGRGRAGGTGRSSHSGTPSSWSREVPDARQGPGRRALLVAAACLLGPASCSNTADTIDTEPPGLSTVARWDLRALDGKSGHAGLRAFYDVDGDGRKDLITNLGSALDFVALDLEGHELWRNTLDETSSKLAYYAKVVEREALVLYGSRLTDTVYALDLRDGTLRWSRAVRGELVALEISTLGVVYGTSEEVGILGYAGGAPLAAGWPISFPQHEQILGAGDLTGDGVDEIVVNDDAGTIQVRRADASLLFEIRSRHTHVDLSTIADIDPTHPGNELFVLIDDDGDAGGEGDEFALYDARGRRIRVFEAPHGGVNPAVGDVLPDTPGLEIAFGLEGRGMVGLLTGTLRPVFVERIPGVGGGQIALADLFGDGALEILANTGEEPDAGFVVLDARGHVLASQLGKGWDFDPSAQLANAAPGPKQFVDVTGDGVPDVHASRVGADSRHGHEVLHLLTAPRARPRGRPVTRGRGRPRGSAGRPTRATSPRAGVGRPHGSPSSSPAKASARDRPARRSRSLGSGSTPPSSFRG